MKQVLLPISETTFQKAKQIASQSNRTIEDILAEFTHLGSEVASLEANKEDEAMIREKRAYLALHAELLKSHAGEFVAIYKERLIDHDTERRKLMERINTQYPDEFVWVSQVNEKPIREFKSTSFRIKT